jgi:pilus assembly protein CpaB
MGSFRGFLMIVLAILLAAGAGALTYLYVLKSTEAEAIDPIETSPLVVASRDMTFGTKLEAEHIRLVDFPSATIPVGAYSDIDSVLGQTIKVFLVEGEPILASKLSTAGGGLSVRIPESLRATSIKVNEISGVSGFVLPGDRVDVLATIDNYGKAGNSATRTILQNLEVLAAGIKTQTKNDKPIEVQTVTLLVDPRGAEDLALAIHQGKIHLVLRNPADHEIAKVEATNTQKMMGQATTKRRSTRRTTPKPKPVEEKPVPAEPGKESFTVIRDGKIEEQKPPQETPKGP